MSSLNLNLRGPDHPLRVLRREAGLSQQALADQVGLHQTAVSHIETGAPLYRGYTSRLCAQALGVELSDVLGPAQRELYAKIVDAGLDDLWVGAHEERKNALRELLHTAEAK